MMMMFVILLGVVSLTDLKFELMPKINPPIVAILTSYPGAGPEEVKEMVTKPLEDFVATSPGLTDIRSQSSSNSSLIIATFDWDSSIEEVRNDIGVKMEQAMLPSDVQKPMILKFDPTMIPIMQFSISGGKDLQELQKFVDERVVEELERVNGVAKIDIIGAVQQEVQVKLNTEKLKEYNLTQQAIIQFIQGNDLLFPGGVIETEKEKLSIKIVDQIKTKEDLENIPVSIKQEGEKSNIVYLKDIGTITTEQVEKTSVARSNQEDSLLLNIQKEGNANTVEVAQSVRKLLAELESEEEDVSFSVFIDQGEVIETSIGNVSSALVYGAVFAVLVILFFLKSFRATLIVGIAIPFSVVATFVLMYFSGMTLNIMSLGGLALGVGMLVDNAIVVIENIHRHLKMGKNRLNAAIDGAAEISNAVIASTLTTVVVFLPIIFIQGVIGDIFKEIALTVAFSLFASLIVALTVVPTLAALLIKEIKEPKAEAPIYKHYRKALKWTLGNRLVVLLLVTLLIIFSLFSAKEIGTEFMPKQDSNSFTVNVKLTEGSKIDETVKVIEEVESQLMDSPLVQSVTSMIGTGDALGDAVMSSSENLGEIVVNLTASEDRAESTEEVLQKFKKTINTTSTTVELAFEENSSDDFGGSSNELTVLVLENDKQSLEDATNVLVNKLDSKLDNITEIETSLNKTKFSFHFVPDKTKLLPYGLSGNQVANQIRDAIQGNVIATLSNNGVETNVRILSGEKIKTKNDLESLLISTSNGLTVPLQELGSITKEAEAVTILRDNKKDSSSITIAFKEKDLGTMKQEIEKVIDEEEKEWKINDSTEVIFDGNSQMMEDSFSELTFALILAVVLVFMVMASQFESFAQPLIIMLSIPLAITGVVFGLLATGYSFGITAFIGIIILSGIVVNNAIVFLDYTNQLKSTGLSVTEALIEAGSKRIKPITMTALTTILGLLPLAIGTGEGAQMQAPMAVAVIGGLFTSTLLTLFVIPVMYSLMESIKGLPKKVKRLKEMLRKIEE